MPCSPQQINDNGGTAYVDNINNAVMISFENNNPNEKISKDIISNILLMSWVISKDIINYLPIIDWSDEEKYYKDLFYIYFYSSDFYNSELREKEYERYKNCPMPHGFAIDLYTSRTLEINFDGIDRFIDKMSIMDILSSLYQTYYIDFEEYEKYKSYYKYINITTLKDNEKCLELICQFDDETKERKLTILDKNGGNKNDNRTTLHAHCSGCIRNDNGAHRMHQLWEIENIGRVFDWRP